LVEKREKKIHIEVISQKGNCYWDHKKGQSWEFQGLCPGGMCSTAFHAAFPYILSLQNFGTFYWEKQKGTADVACPDGENPVIFRISVID